MNLSQGTLLQNGKYEIVRYISSGGFGCTYEAKHVLFGKSVAIKEFFVKDFCNRDSGTKSIYVPSKSMVSLVEKLRGKFIAEAQALFEMNHPNIVRVTDVFEENGTAYYVMDYINGSTLDGIIKSRGALAESEARHYISQVSKALKYVHDRNRLHLDIKPANIMVDTDGFVVLIDFGVSKQYDEVDNANTSTLVGSTPGYAPIEQSGAGLAKFYPATDIYALGATLYKALTGITPPQATLIASGESELPPLPATITSATRKAVEAAMRIQRSKRPQSIEEFLSLLNEDVRKSERGSSGLEDIVGDVTVVDDVGCVYGPPPYIEETIKERTVDDVCQVYGPPPIFKDINTPGGTDKPNNSSAGPVSMTFFAAILSVYKNYFNFSGRARRKEYWSFVLFSFIVQMFAVSIGSFEVYAAFMYLSFIPGLALSFRRMHDSGRSAFCFLFLLIPLFGWIEVLTLMLHNSKSGSNRWGANPKGIE